MSDFFHSTPARMCHYSLCGSVCTKGPETQLAWSGSKGINLAEDGILCKLCTCHDWCSFPHRAVMRTHCHPCVGLQDVPCSWASTRWQQGACPWELHLGKTPHGKKGEVSRLRLSARDTMGTAPWLPRVRKTGHGLWRVPYPLSTWQNVLT